MNRAKQDGSSESSERNSYLIAAVLACIGLWTFGESIYAFARNKQPSDRQIFVLQGTIWLVVIVAVLNANWWFLDNVVNLKAEELLFLPYMIGCCALVYHLSFLLTWLIVPKSRSEQS